MKTYTNQELFGFYDRGTGGVFADLEFRNCSVSGCGLTVTNDASRRSVVRNVRAVDCSVRGSNLGATVFDEVLVENLRTDNFLAAHGAVFRHVTLRGRFGVLVSLPAPLCYLSGVARDERGAIEQRVRVAFEEANRAFYDGVDWALDLRELEVEKSFEILGVPARLVLRDEATQAIMTREAALGGAWREMEVDWAAAIERLLASGAPDAVLVTPKRAPGPRRDRRLRDLKRLRDAGLVHLAG